MERHLVTAKISWGIYFSLFVICEIMSEFKSYLYAYWNITMLWYHWSIAYNSKTMWRFRIRILINFKYTLHWLWDTKSYTKILYMCIQKMLWNYVLLFLHNIVIHNFITFLILNEYRFIFNQNWNLIQLTYIWLNPGYYLLNTIFR